jgi:Rieske Fe-S protein
VVEDVTITIGPDSPLGKVGGFQIVDSSAGKLIVIHAAEDKFVAYSAKCTHRGGIVAYDADKKQIHCPKHGSNFDPATGDVVKGPADKPLPSYPTDVSGQTVTVKA